MEARDGVGVTQLGGSVQQPQGSHVVLLTKLDLVAAKGRGEEGGKNMTFRMKKRRCSELRCNDRA